MTTAVLLSENEAAAYLGGISPKTLTNWRYMGQGPSFVKIGRCIRYSPADLDRYVEAGRKERLPAC